MQTLEVRPTERHRRRRIRRRPAAATALVVVVVAAGCGVLEPGEGSAAGDLARARASWAAAALDDYDLLQTRHCFCVQRGVVRVEVRGGERSSTVVEADDAPIDPAEVLFYPTVPELFDLVAEAIEQEAAELRVTYHPVLGYPVQLWIDRSYQIADEELGFDTELAGPDTGS